MIKINQLVIANKDIYFCDNTFHLKNSKHIITKETIAYYNCNLKDYTKYDYRKSI